MCTFSLKETNQDRETELLFSTHFVFRLFEISKIRESLSKRFLNLLILEDTGLLYSLSADKLYNEKCYFADSPKWKLYMK